MSDEVRERASAVPLPLVAGLPLRGLEPSVFAGSRRRSLLVVSLLGLALALALAASIVVASGLRPAPLGAALELVSRHDRPDARAPHGSPLRSGI